MRSAGFHQLDVRRTDSGGGECVLRGAFDEFGARGGVDVRRVVHGDRLDGGVHPAPLGDGVGPGDDHGARALPQDAQSVPYGARFEQSRAKGALRSGGEVDRADQDGFHGGVEEQQPGDVQRLDADGASEERVKEGPVRFHSEETRLAMTLPM